MMYNVQTKLGCKDIWDAYMCKGATYSVKDIPFCPTTADTIPAELIPWNIMYNVGPSC